MDQRFSAMHIEKRGVRICTFINYGVAGSKWTIEFVQCDATPTDLRQIADKLDELNGK